MTQAKAVMRTEAGHARALGATCEAGGVNVAVFSRHATRIELCLFAPDGRETARLPLPERTGHIRHGFFPGLKPGDLYALRAHGPWNPAAGHRFNPAKLLLDPWARALSGPVVWSPALRGEDAHGHPDPVDSAPHLPRCVVTAPAPPIDEAERPRTPWDRTVIYEAHVRSLTRLHPDIPEAERGTYDALGHPAVIAHLKALGVTALELLPVMAFMDEPRLLALGLRNHWGYNTCAFFAPEPRYFGPMGAAGLRESVRRLHAAGIEVILDVVYNHTAELDAHGPTLSLRGLDDQSWYLHAAGAPGGGYVNHSGCGNTVDLSHPFAQRLTLDSLRWWAEVVGVDGFRFDLATVLGRETGGRETGGREPGAFDPGAGLLDAILADPLLSGLKLIAEPWDLGPGGYQAGRFPAPFAEWNDGFRDATRRAWRRDARGAHDLATALLGSAHRFDREGRPPWSSVNFVAAHDGFTLADLTLYAERRNHANGEGNRDGHSHEISDPMGPEGPTRDPAQTAARDRRRRAMLATLFVAQGAPMLRAGDEVAQSQGGNNNAYCQDNAISWIDWAAADDDLVRFTQACAALRARLPALRQRRFLHDRLRPDGKPEAIWHALEGGAPMWDSDGLPGKFLLLRGPADVPEGDDPAPVLIGVNLGLRDVSAVPPPAGASLRWRWALCSTARHGAPGEGPEWTLPAGSLRVWETAPA